MNDEIEIKDEITITQEADTVPETWKKYRVTAEDGIFKRGKLWTKGEEIELDPATADRFKALGEVEDV